MATNLDEVGYDQIRMEVMVPISGNQLMHMRDPVFTYVYKLHVPVEDVDENEYAWCGFCTKIDHSVCGNLCDHRGTGWCGHCDARTVAWCSRDCVTARLLDVWHHHRYMRTLTRIMEVLSLIHISEPTRR